MEKLAVCVGSAQDQCKQRDSKRVGDNMIKGYNMIKGMREVIIG